MFKYQNNLLPCYFDTVFNLVSDSHGYNRRSAARQSYYSTKSRTNYGIFNISFQGPNVGNSFDKYIKDKSLNRFNENIKIDLL